MMMRAGISYADWRLMAPFQRRDWLARRTMEREAMMKKLTDANMGTLVGVALAKFLES